MAAAALAAIPSAGAAQPVATNPTLSASAATGAQRAALMAQLVAAAGADSPLVKLELQLGTAQTQTSATLRQLDALNARLVALSQQIPALKKNITAGKPALSRLLRSSYVLAGGNNFTDYVLSGSDFAQVITRLSGAQHMTDDLRNALQTLHDNEAALTVQQAELQQDLVSSQQTEKTLNAQSNWLIAVLATRDAALPDSSANVRSIIAQLEGFDQHQATAVVTAATTAAAAPAPVSHGPVNSSGPCGNHFAFGQCTWYVASRRCVPWFGNAFQWWSAARAYGYAEGSTPAAGAVVVWYPGGGGAGSVGHVGYVEAVGPAGGVPAGSFRLTEMNFTGFDQTDSRTLPNNSPGIAGFIY